MLKIIRMNISKKTHVTKKYMECNGFTLPYHAWDFNQIDSQFKVSKEDEGKRVWHVEDTKTQETVLVSYESVNKVLINKSGANFWIDSQEIIIHPDNFVKKRRKRKNKR